MMSVVPVDTTEKKALSETCSRREILKYGLYGSLAAGLSSSLWLSGCRKGLGRDNPNIILIVLDTTRVDRLSCYGYWRRTSPNLDKLAGESVVYTRAIAPSSWTLPAHASLFTGKFTSSHGARTDPEGPLRLTDAVQDPTIPRLGSDRARGLAADELTLAMILKEAGYATGAVVGGPWLKRFFGLDKGFDYYDDNEISTVNGRLAEKVTAGAVRWLKAAQKEKFFLFLNYFDPHTPYNAPGDFDTVFMPKDTNKFYPNTEKYVRNAIYDAEIFYMDHHIGKLLEQMKAGNLYEKTWIIVTADHGELLGEHGQFFHGDFLYQEEIHIPLFLKYPAREVQAGRTDLQVQLTDILPMICERLGLAVPENIQGSSPPRISHPIIAETYPMEHGRKSVDWRVIFDGDFKFHWSSEGYHQLYDVKNDPSESVNLVNQYPERSEKMMTELNRYLADLPSPGPAAPARQLDEQTKEALKSLGYVD